MSTAGTQWVRATLVMAAVVVLDQATKAIVVSSLAWGESVDVFAGLNLTHVQNSGVAFGVLADKGAAIIALGGLALVLLLAYLAQHTGAPRLWLPIGMILGGALGNLADRARQGMVIDFIDPVAWPAFNVADIGIVVGMLLLLYLIEAPRHRAR